MTYCTYPKYTDTLTPYQTSAAAVVKYIVAAVKHLPVLHHIADNTFIIHFGTLS